MNNNNKLLYLEKIGKQEMYLKFMIRDDSYGESGSI